MNVLNEQMTRSEPSNDAPLIALGKERVAAWVRYRGRQSLSTIGRFPPPRTWTPKSPRSWRRPKSEAL
jgi:hypothetical protein